MSRKTFLSVREICYIAMFTALIAVLSPLAIPMPYGVPMTLQSFIIPFAAVVLGAKRGMIAAIAYVLLGAVGLPIFSNFGGGLAWLIGPTGGFLLAFPFYARLAGWGADQGLRPVLAGSLFLGVTLFYTIGMVHFSLVTGRSIPEAFAIAVLPFLPTEAIKIALVWILGRNIRTAVEKSGALPQGNLHKKHIDSLDK